MALDKIAICNQALGECPAPAIVSFDEVSTEAEWAARLYSPTLAYLLDRHDWKFPRERVVLAPVANDRAGEWGFAYAIPEECVSELRVMPTYALESVDVPLLAGQILSPLWAALAPIGYRYLVAGDRIYTNIEAATLEYIRGDASEQALRPLFTRAFVAELASRLVMPVLKDRQRQGDLIKMAEVALDRAIADERMRDPSEARYGDFVSDMEVARSGGIPGVGWYGSYPNSRGFPW